VISYLSTHGFGRRSRIGIIEVDEASTRQFEPERRDEAPRENQKAEGGLKMRTTIALSTAVLLALVGTAQADVIGLTPTSDFEGNPVDGSDTNPLVLPATVAGTDLAKIVVTPSGTFSAWETSAGLAFTDGSQWHKWLHDDESVVLTFQDSLGNPISVDLGSGGLNLNLNQDVYRAALNGQIPQTFTGAGVSLFANSSNVTQILVQGADSADESTYHKHNGVALTSIDIVPEPATMSLLGLGGLVALRRRRRA
jgi:hypothetical protein